MSSLSVVVTVYNELPFLRRCLDSLIGQEAEIIIVDDGSTDGSDKLCDKYKKYGFKVFHKKNGGVSSARNFGLEKATGDFVTFLDSDDEWLPEASQVILSKLKNQNIISFNHQRQHGDLPVRVHNKRPVGKYGVLYRASCWWAVWDKIYKRDFLLNNKIRFDEQVNYGEDELFNLDCLLINETYIHYGECFLLRHFDNQESLVHSLTNKGVLEQYDGLARRREKIIKIGVRWQLVVVDSLMKEHRNSFIYRRRLNGLTPEEYRAN